MNALIAGQNDKEIIDLRVIIARLMAKRWWILGSVLLSTLAFSLSAFVTTPIYRASVTLIPASAERGSLSGSLNSAFGQLSGIASLAGVNVGGNDAATEEALAVLHSRDFTRKFIEDNKLMPSLFSSKWDSQRQQWRGSASEQPTEWQAYKYFDGHIRSVIQDKKTGFVTLQVDWSDGVIAALWANELVQLLNDEMRSRAISKAGASLQFLEKELGTTSIVEVREAINRLVETQVKQRMLAEVTNEYSFRVIDKAIAPDRRDPIKPNKFLLLIMGPIFGFTVGAVSVLLLDAFRTPAL